MNGNLSSSRLMRKILGVVITLSLSFVIWVTPLLADMQDAFLWQNGTMVNLPNYVGYWGSYASDINNSGQIVGQARDRTGLGQAVIWQNGGVNALWNGYATGINDSGQVVGTSGSQAVIWQNGTMDILGNLGGSWSNTSAYAINNLGQIVGSCTNSSNGYEQAVIWQNGSITALGINATLSRATAINNLGQVVGYYYDNSVRGFLWQNGTMTDLGPSRRAYGINDFGQIVGDDWGNGCFLWSDGSFTDLTPSGSQYSSAFSINDSGQVVGAWGTYGGANVPVPSTMLLLSSGLLGLVGWRRFRKS